MLISHPIDGVLLLQYNTKPEVSIRFGRLQEFYESPYDSIRGKVFNWETFLLTHFGEDRIQRESYFNYWEGFNVPIETAHSFFNHFHDLSPGEIEIKELLKFFPDTKYLIASFVGADSGVVDHEIAHAQFKLNKEYKEEVINFINQIPPGILNTFKRVLTNEGYTEEVLIDEIHAYLLTSNVVEILTLFGNKGIKFSMKIKQALKKYNYKDENNDE